MKDQHHVVPDKVLNKEFLSQFKTEADVSVPKAVACSGSGKDVQG